MNRREALVALSAAGSAWLAARPMVAMGQGADANLRLLNGQLTQGGWARGFAAPGLSVAFQPKTPEVAAAATHVVTDSLGAVVGLV